MAGELDLSYYGIWQHNTSIPTPPFYSITADIESGTVVITEKSTGTVITDVKEQCIWCVTQFDPSDCTVYWEWVTHERYEDENGSKDHCDCCGRPMFAEIWNQGGDGICAHCFQLETWCGECDNSPCCCNYCSDCENDPCCCGCDDCGSFPCECNSYPAITWNEDHYVLADVDAIDPDHLPAWVLRDNDLVSYHDTLLPDVDTVLAERGMDCRSVDLVVAMSDFYLLEAIAHGFINRPPVMIDNTDQRLTRMEATMMRDELIARHVPIIFNYLDMTVGGELRHMFKFDRWYLPMYRSQCWRAWDVIRKKHGTLALREAQRLFLEGGSYRSGYGGGPWAIIADITASYAEGKFTDAQFLDRAWTLAHHNGPVFNKVDWKRKNLSALREIGDAHASDNFQLLLMNASRPVISLFHEQWRQHNAECVRAGRRPRRPPQPQHYITQEMSADQAGRIYA